jgi:mono/diheme cytochrome c family protein
MGRCSVLFALVTSFLFVSMQTVSAQTPVYETSEAAQANADFKVQGEYASATRGMQVIALGKGEFDIKVYNGGLPGAGWDRSPVRELDGDADDVAELVESSKLQRVERTSPTMGLKPPAGAVVLFNGTQASLDAHWEKEAKITKDGLLIQGVTSKDKFQHYSMHLEFRTPFMPEARGQKRGNSGLYHQGRYETQILDSFGLEGLNNETGGLYSIKAPDLNMCLPPLVWQTYDIEFTAAEFNESGKKKNNAKITVKLNGVIVQQDVRLPKTTTAAPLKEDAEPGPIFLQDHGNEVRFRNIWVLPRDLAQESRRPRVVGFERFYAQGEPNALGGHALIAELGCTACHSHSDANAKQAPILDVVGRRVRPDHLLAFISQPHTTKTGSTMPDLFAGLSADERKANAEAIASFLLTTGSTADRSGDPLAVHRGEDIYHSIGCIACHPPQNAMKVSEATSVPLPDLGAKYTLDSLIGFLREPHAVRPSGRMPTFNLNEQRAQDLATYLLRDAVVGKGAINIKAAFYEGSWKTLPSLDELKPFLETETHGLDLLASKRKDNFAVRFDTTIIVPKDANYTFRLGSDDGSRLFVDGKQVIENDGIHPMDFKIGKAKLTAGPHAVRVEYFEGGGGEELALQIEGGGLERTSIGAIATLDAETKAIESLVKPQFAGSPPLVEKGRELFASVGCASCHQLKVDDKPIVSTVQAKAFANLDLEKGCMASMPPATAPQYDLSMAQRATIRLAASDMREGKKLDDAAQVQLTMTSMNCYACHSRDGIGGPELSRDPVFKTTVKEMGDECRVPPVLTGVGDKLQKSYLESILDKGVEERSYMLVNMPGFGANNLNGIVNRIVRLDEKSTAEIKQPHEPEEKVKSDGRLLVGEKGLSCVKCHTFGGKGARGIGAIDLQRMTTRLREDWFHRYLMSPTTYRPGTRMPASFPDGKSVLPGLYEGEPSPQIAAMWSFLSDGNKAREPLGVQQQKIELVPTERPTIYRNFIEGLTPRAIAVGYPQKANLAWDANRLCLTLMWKGGFIDASKHWVGRGPGTQDPLGDDLVSFEKNTPIAILAAPDAEWPTGSAKDQGYQFLGYRLNEFWQPTFRYKIGEATIEDTPVPAVVEGRVVGFDRKFKVTGATKKLYFRAASGKKIEPAADNWYRLDGKVSIHLDTSAALTQVDGNSEMRVPIAGETFNVTQQIRW